MKNNCKNLNLNYLTYSNQTYAIGKYDMPYIANFNVDDIDYIALYSDKDEYHKTDNTAVCFYQYDNIFDGIHGIFNAIYYNDTKLLEQYKVRFKDVKYIISPDYSQCGDIQTIENLYRFFKARIVSLWFILELDIQVIPNITYGNESYFDVMLEGMEDVEVVCISTMGSYRNKEQKALLVKAIKYTVDHLANLKQILVYTTNRNDSCILSLFNYAINKGISVVIPDNKLRIRNKLKGDITNG